MGNSDHGTTYMRVGGDDGELRPWHYIYVYSIESRLTIRVRYDNGNSNGSRLQQITKYGLLFVFSGYFLNFNATTNIPGYLAHKKHRPPRTLQKDYA